MNRCSTAKGRSGWRALDLFCRAGGASMGLHQAGFEVVGVDIELQPNYPFRFIQADALAFPLDGYDLIWASPPCQRYATVTRQHDEHPDLIAPIRARLRATGAPWIIENVVGAPLRNPIMLCGQMFGLGVARHRIFETSWLMLQPPHPRHRGSLVTGEIVSVVGNGGGAAWTLREREKRGLPRNMPGDSDLDIWRKAMGIDWMTRKELVQAIPPPYAKFLGEAACLAIIHHKEGVR